MFDDITYTKKDIEKILNILNNTTFTGITNIMNVAEIFNILNTPFIKNQQQQEKQVTE